jgi:hypothetical protein
MQSLYIRHNDDGTKNIIFKDGQNTQNLSDKTDEALAELMSSYASNTLKDHTLNLSLGEGKYIYENHEQKWLEAKRTSALKKLPLTLPELTSFLTGEAMNQPVAAKEEIKTLLYGGEFDQSIEVKRNTNTCVNRSCLFLDFDDELGKNLTDLAKIQNIFKDYWHITYTTHSYGEEAPAKGKRYRVVLPLQNTIKKEDWSTFAIDLSDALDYMGLPKKDKDNPNQINELDETSKTVTQGAYTPQASTYNKTITLYYNIGDSTKLFDLGEIQKRLSITPAPKIQSNISSVRGTTSALNDQQQELYLQIMRQKPNLNLPQDQRKILAGSFKNMGFSESDFCSVDQLHQKYKSNTTSKKAWREHMGKDAGKTTLLKYLTDDEKNQINRLYLPATTQQPQKTQTIDQSFLDHQGWADVIQVDKYITPELFDQITTDPVTKKLYKQLLIAGDVGIGKSFTHSSRINTKDDATYIFVPLRTIEGQQNQSFDEKTNTQTHTTLIPKNLTYDKAITFNEKIKNNEIIPENTTLIIDECHNLMTAEFRHTALQNMMNLLQNYNWRQIIMQSATVRPKVFKQIFEDMREIRVIKNTKPIIDYNQILVPLSINQKTSKPYVDEKIADDQIVTIALDAKRKNQKIIIYRAGNEKKLTDLQSRLENLQIKTLLATATTTKNKKHPAHQLASNANWVMHNTPLIKKIKKIKKANNTCQFSKARQSSQIIKSKKQQPKTQLEIMRKLLSKQRAQITKVLNKAKINNTWHNHLIKINDPDYQKPNQKNYDLILGTQSIVEGINIQDQHDDWCVIILDFPQTLTHWSTMGQLTGRCRKAKHIYLHHLQWQHQIDKHSNNWVTEQEYIDAKFANYDDAVINLSDPTFNPTQYNIDLTIDKYMQDNNVRKTKDNQYTKSELGVLYAIKEWEIFDQAKHPQKYLHYLAMKPNSPLLLDSEENICQPKSQDKRVIRKLIKDTLQNTMDVMPDDYHTDIYDKFSKDLNDHLQNTTDENDQPIYSTDQIEMANEYLNNIKGFLPQMIRDYQHTLIQVPKLLDHAMQEEWTTENYQINRDLALDTDETNIIMKITDYLNDRKVDFDDKNTWLTQNDLTKIQHDILMIAIDAKWLKRKKNPKTNQPYSVFGRARYLTQSTQHSMSRFRLDTDIYSIDPINEFTSFKITEKTDRSETSKWIRQVLFYTNTAIISQQFGKSKVRKYYIGPASSVEE